MNALDFVWIAVVLVGVILGFRKGFFGSITKPIKVIASLCLTILISTPVLNVWTRDFFVGKIESSMTEALANAGAVSTDELPTLVKFFAELLNIDTAGIATIDGMVAALSAPIGNFVAVIVTYVALFIILMLLLTIFVALLDIAFNKGFLGKINKLLGLLLGAVIAAVVACIIVNIVGAFAPSVIGGPISQFFKSFNPFAFVLKF